MKNDQRVDVIAECGRCGKKEVFRMDAALSLRSYLENYQKYQQKNKGELEFSYTPLVNEEWGIWCKSCVLAGNELKAAQELQRKKFMAGAKMTVKGLPADVGDDNTKGINIDIVV